MFYANGMKIAHHECKRHVLIIWEFENEKRKIVDFRVILLGAVFLWSPCIFNFTEQQQQQEEENPEHLLSVSHSRGRR